jgi:hypothetical protein
MPEEVAILGLTTIISSTIVILYGIRAWSVRGRAKGAAEIPRQVDQRLERIEQAVDAIAIEAMRDCISSGLSRAVQNNPVEESGSGCYGQVADADIRYFFPLVR